MRHRLRVRALAAALVFCCTLAAGVNSLHAYPDRPINLVVPWGVGGGGDRVGRVIAGLLASKLGVSVPVINITGASGQVGLNKVLSEPADGYNIIEITSDTYILFARPNSRFKVADFAPIAIVDQQLSGFFLRYDSPWKTWNDVLAAAKTKSVRVAGSGIGTQSDVTVNYLNRDMGLNFVSIPFPDPGLRWSAVLGDHADLTYAQFGDLDAFLASKQLRPILAFADKRVDSFPDIPASKELGYRINITHFRSIAVKAGTPSAIFNMLVGATNAISDAPEYKKMLEAQTALPDSYISAPKAQDYVEAWVSAVRSLTSTAAQ
jgi:tripartite-type tricarboxylate transporter receptor subunit TctC